MSEEFSSADIAEAVEAVEAKEKPRPAALKTFVDWDQLKKDVSIKDTDLDSVMMGHASLYVHYATLTVQARRQYERLKHAFEILEAKLYAEYRVSLEEGKKPTEASIRNALVADKRWSGAQARLIDAQSIWKTCEAAENALMQRKDMILEIARDRRREREGELRVREAGALRESTLDLIAKHKAA